MCSQRMPDGGEGRDTASRGGREARSGGEDLWDPPEMRWEEAATGILLQNWECN